MSNDSNKTETNAGKLLNAAKEFSSAWPVVVSIAYLISVIFSLLYWSKYYQYLEVSFYSYLRLEDLATAIFRKPDLFASTVSLVVVAYFASKIAGGTKYNRPLVGSIFAFAIAAMPFHISASARGDAAEVLVLKSPYHDVTLTGKTAITFKAVILVGVMSDFVVIYSPKTMKSTVVPKPRISLITSSSPLEIDDSRNASSFLSYIGPNLYDENKLKYRGYSICAHKMGGVLPCRDKSGNLIVDKIGLDVE